MWLFVAVVALPLFLFTVDLGTPSLWDPDEGRPAEVAREMLITRKWLTPQLNFLPYAEKSPVYFWLLAGAQRLFGERNEAAIRLPSAAVAIVGIWVLLVWGWRHLRPISAVFAALILSTAAGYVAIGRLVVEDAIGGLCLAVSLLGMSEPLLSNRGSVPWLFYLAIAAATLIQGPAVLLLPPLVALTFVSLLREPDRLLDLRPVRGTLIVAAMILPVFVLAAIHDPAYVSELFGQHSGIRFLDPNFADDHSYSLSSYLLIVPLLMLPWGIFLPWSLPDAFRAGRERSPDARLYLMAWLLADLAYFELTASNVVSYVVLALFPLALLTGRALARFLRSPRAESLFLDPVLLGSGLLFVAVLVGPYATRRFMLTEFPMYADKIVFSFLLIPFAVGGIGAVTARSRLGALGAVTACGIATLFGLYHYGSETVSAYNSMEVPAELIALKLPPSAPLVSYGTTSHSLAFYSGRPVRTLPSVAQAEPLLNGTLPAALLTKERYLPEVRAELKRAVYIWWVGDSKKILLANTPPPPSGDRRILLPAPAPL
jgi:4-amino-4-deoxy-L-arabinose transferase-like glycosyltransferase